MKTQLMKLEKSLKLSTNHGMLSTGWELSVLLNRGQM